MPWDSIQAAKLGASLQDLRKDRGLTQEQLAYAAGITKNQVQLLESGRASGRKDEIGHSNPRIKTLSGLADALGVSLSELIKSVELAD